jgi:hypothetical protein
MNVNKNTTNVKHFTENKFDNFQNLCKHLRMIRHEMTTSGSRLLYSFVMKVFQLKFQNNTKLNGRATN